MLIQTQVGPIASVTSLGAGTQVTARAGQMGDTIVSELQGRYYELCYRRQLYRAANTAGVTTTVGPALTYVGLCLSNPVGNIYNLVLLQCGYSGLVAWPAASSVGLQTGYNSSTNVTHTTPITPLSTFVGVGTAPTGLTDSAATLPTAPTRAITLGVGLTGAITTVPSIPASFFDIGGSIVLPPGAYVAFDTSTVSGASGFMGSFLWAEIPV